MAVGGNPFVPKIDGMDLPGAVDVTDAHRNGVKGQKMVICGGGCDSALELREEGKDVTNSESIIAVRDRIVETFGKVTILVNNAGGGIAGIG